MTFSEALEEYLETREAIAAYDDGNDWNPMRRECLVERKREAMRVMDRLAPGDVS